MQSSIQRDIFQVSLLKFYEKAKKKQALVSENADDEKNLHPGGRKKKKKLMNLIEFFK